MTLENVGIAANLLGLLIPLAFSLAITKTYPQPYFANWTLSYLFFAVSVMLLSRTELFGSARLLALLLVIVYTAASWFLLRAAFTVQHEERVPRGIDVAAALTLALGFALELNGQTFALTATGPILLGFCAHIVLAWKLGRLPSRPGYQAHNWLAGLVAVTGTWALAFPLLKGDMLYLGFFVSGILHLMVGIFMVIFLLEDVAYTLQLQNEELKQLDRLKSDFISTVSHELRTPLSSIKSASWLLQNHRTAINEDELIGIIANQSDTLQRLVNDVLDFAKMEAGSLSYNLDVVDLEHLVRAAVHDASPRFAQKGIAMDFESVDDDVQVKADADRLAQVISNLLSNALKFTEPGGHVMVQVAIQQGEARLVVSDTGIGIPAEYHQRIFERFFQVDNTSTRQVGGAGLGLAISKAIVEEGHHGRIWVEHAPGGGSAFIVALQRANIRGEPTKSLESHPSRE